MIEFFQVVRRLRDLAFETRDIRPLDPPAFQLGQLEIRSIQEYPERQLDVLGNRVDGALALGCHFLTERF